MSSTRRANNPGDRQRGRIRPHPPAAAWPSAPARRTIHCSSTSSTIRVCVGFRMPVGRDLAGGAWGRRPKAARERTRGGRARRGVYGDLTVAAGREGQGRWRRASAWLPERSRQAWRRERSRPPRLAEVGAIGGPGRRLERTRVLSAWRRRRGPAAGVRCGEALLSPEKVSGSNCTRGNGVRNQLRVILVAGASGYVGLFRTGKRWRERHFARWRCASTKAGSAAFMRAW
jgi:hypothetical protein